MRLLRPAPADHLAALETLEGAIRAAEPEQLRELLADLGRLKALAVGTLLLDGRATSSPAALLPEALLTVEQAAKFLAISTSETYRRSRTDLKPARVAVGKGQVRFDPRKLREIVKARTGR